MHCLTSPPSPACLPLQEYGGKVPPADQVSLDDLKEVVAAFNRSMAEALAFVQERKPGMVTLLEKSVKEQLEKLQVRAWGAGKMVFRAMGGEQGEGQGFERPCRQVSVSVTAALHNVTMSLIVSHSPSHLPLLLATLAAVSLIA